MGAFDAICILPQVIRIDRHCHSAKFWIQSSAPSALTGFVKMILGLTAQAIILCTSGASSNEVFKLHKEAVSHE
jgi:hypothetical protein